MLLNTKKKDRFKNAYSSHNSIEMIIKMKKDIELFKRNYLILVVIKKSMYSFMSLIYLLSFLFHLYWSDIDRCLWIGVFAWAAFQTILIFLSYDTDDTHH